MTFRAVLVGLKVLGSRNPNVLRFFLTEDLIMPHRRLLSALIAGGSTLIAIGAALLASTPSRLGASPLHDIPPFTDHECLACHTDQARLQELALPVEEKGESLSSGPG